MDSYRRNSACAKISGSVGSLDKIQKHIACFKEKPFVNKPDILGGIIILCVAFPTKFQKPDSSEKIAFLTIKVIQRRISPADKQMLCFCCQPYKLLSLT